MALIDREGLGLIDAGAEIAIIFDSFDFSEKQKEFLREYLDLRNDPTIKRRIRAFWPIQLFGVFCWAVMHVFEIGEEELHERFIQEQDLQRHVDYAKKMFEKCRSEGIFSKETRWKSSDIFPEKYLAQSSRISQKGQLSKTRCTSQLSLNATVSSEKCFWQGRLGQSPRLNPQPVAPYFSCKPHPEGIWKLGSLL